MIVICFNEPHVVYDNNIRVRTEDHMQCIALQVPTYTFVTQHQDQCNTVDVTYAMFYPYNYGKVKP